VLIMTSNLGTEFLTKAGSLGFLKSEDQGDREAEAKIEKALRDTFRPEFLNRIDEIIIFSPLSMEQMQQIVDLQMMEIQHRLSEHGLKVKLTETARNWLAEEGYDPAFGARPLRRALQKHVESPLSIKLLKGEYQEGDTVIVDFNETDDRIEFLRPNASEPIEVEQEVPA
jgi:ATP-dependent Clp protease ATP-binding subunit ClpC